VTDDMIPQRHYYASCPDSELWNQPASGHETEGYVYSVPRTSRRGSVSATVQTEQAGTMRMTIKASKLASSETRMGGDARTGERRTSTPEPLPGPQRRPP
jgi:hypothetical protein